MTEKLGMGIAGYGGHAQHHANHWGKYFKTVQIYDPGRMDFPDDASSMKKLCRNPDVTAVFIGSPESEHIKQIRIALKAGKHVLCEKPLGTSKSELKDLIKLFEYAASRNLVLDTCHPRRHDRPMIWLRKIIRSIRPERIESMKAHRGDVELYYRLGNPLSINFDFSYHEPSAVWKKKRSLLRDHVNHEVDLLNFFFGISGFEAWRLHDSFDHYEVVGKRDDDITFSFKGTRRLKSGRYPEWCTVRFEKGEIRVDMMHGTAYITYHDGGWADSSRPSIEMYSDLSIDYDGRLLGVAKSFHQAIHGKKPYLSVSEMLMNTEAGTVLEKEGLRRVDIRNP